MIWNLKSDRRVLRSTLTTGVFMNEDNVTDFADYLDFGAFAGAPGNAVVTTTEFENGTDSKSVMLKQIFLSEMER